MYFSYIFMTFCYYVVVVANGLLRRSPMFLSQSNFGDDSRMSVLSFGSCIPKQGSVQLFSLVVSYPVIVPINNLYIALNDFVDII